MSTATKARRPTGRPPKSPGLKLRQLVQVSLDDKTYRALLAFMEVDSITSESAAIRSLLVRGLRDRGLIISPDDAKHA